MNIGKTFLWVSAGMISLLAFADHAAADSRRFHRYNNPARHEIRSDRREIWKDRRELHNDRRDLYNDKAELRRDLRRGAPASEIAQDRAKIRQDLSGLFGDRRDLRGDAGELQRDRNRYGWNGTPSNRYNNSNDRSGWWNNWFGR